MTDQLDTSSAPPSTAWGNDGRGTQWANQIAAEVKGRWGAGEQPDAAAVLAEHPELKGYRSVAIDLAHEEYQRRRQAGEPMDAEEFARRFPTLQTSLYLLIRVNSLLDQDPSFRALQADVPWPKAGDSFLGFQLAAELGRGGFGRVFLAREPALGNRQVAIKVAFEGAQEAEMLGQLRHPNIVPVYSVQEDETTGLTAVCMPYLGRATLCDVLDHAWSGAAPPRQARAILDAVTAANSDADSSEPASSDRALCSGTFVDAILHLVAQLADALAYAHRRGICHRDLKPSNVLMALDGRPLLLDFNLSVDGRLPPPRIGGTLPYMAPEELAAVLRVTSESRTAYFDPRSDVFSLGVILYELLTGRLPFMATAWDRPVEEIAAQLREQQEHGPPPVQDRNRLIDKRLARLVNRCLALDPEDRPETADRLAAALRRERTPRRRVQRWIRNHRRAVSIASAVFLSLTLAAASFLVLRPPYAVRQLRQGIAYSEKGEYKLAIGCFTNAIGDAPECVDAAVARGRAYQQLNDFRQAFEDYRSAYDLAPDPRYLALQGYCMSLEGRPAEAEPYYRRAFTDGCKTPALLNNFGYTCCQLGHLAEAQDLLLRAAEADPHPPQVHHALVQVFVNLACQGKPLPRAAILHARKAQETCPPSGQAYYLLAAINAVAARQDPALVKPALDCLERAVGYGYAPNRFKGSSMLSAIAGEPRYKQLLARPAAPTKTAGFSVLVDQL